MITNLFTLTEKLESLKTPCVIQNELTFAEFKEWCNLDRYGNNNPGELPIPSALPWVGSSLRYLKIYSGRSSCLTSLLSRRGL